MCRAVVVAGVAWAAAAHAGPLDQPSFSASPESLRAEAKSASTVDAEVVLLRDDTKIALDDAGRAEHRYRTVFVVNKPGAIDDWGTIELAWSPFYQDKPEVRARVIGPDGRSADLDPGLITDAPRVESSPSVFSDRRRLSAPLPRLAIGAVVEQELVIKDRVPLLEAGTADTHWIARGVPIQRNLFSISAPTAHKPHIVTRGFAKPPVPRTTASGARTTWSYDLGATAAVVDESAGVPGDVTESPYIGYSTAASWSVVAQGYTRLVDQRIAAAKLALPEGIKGATERDTVDRAVHWLHEHVRYTGIELSDAHIVPWQPDETVKRGFGDCKDKATLLVSILRAAGIAADLALLSDGTGHDVDRDLPGMGMFDHVIVRARVDGKPLWIDATEDSLPVGQLPARDQGRLALVAAASTRDLETIPASRSIDNVKHDTRTYRAAEYERGKVTEVSTESGVFFDAQRDWYRDRSHDDVSKQLAKYVESEFHGKLASFSATDPTDLAHPFALTIEAQDVRRVFTERRQVDVYLWPTDVLADVPALLDSDNAEDDRRAKDRTFDYVWYRPFVREIENRVVAPPGYTLPQLTAHEQRTLGTMTLTIDRRIERDSVVITYRLDSGKSRISHADVAATRDAVKQLRKEGAEHVVLAQTGWTLVRQGKLKEAIAEYQRLIALHPKEALHYDQLADAYRAAGMGVAARRAARKGVEIEPVADAYDMLAWQLRCDSLGRAWGFDHDRKGAIAAYRKAIALDPKHMGALADFAALLARGEHDFLTTNQADRREAISLWRRAREQDSEKSWDSQIAENLLLVGDLAGAEAFTRDMAESETRSFVRIAAVATQRGAKEASALLASLPRDQDREKVIQGAVGNLLFMRKYDLARELYAEGKQESTLASALAHAAVIDPAKLDPADPKTPAIQAMRRILGATVEHPPWDPILSDDLDKIARSIRYLPQMRMFTAMPRPVADDLVLSFLHQTVTGTTKDGWHVIIEIGPAKIGFYITSEHGRAVLLGMTEDTSGAASRAMTMLRAGDVAGAARWIDWMISDLERVKTKSFGAEIIKVFRQEQRRAGAQPLARDVLEVVAAALAVDHGGAAAAPVLRECPPSGDDVKKLCRDGLRGALSTQKQWKELEAAEKLEADQLEPDVVMARSHALAELGRFDEAAAVVDAALAKSPDDHVLLSHRADIEIDRGKWQLIQPWLDRLTDLSSVTAGDLNNAAWTYLYFDTTPAHARELGQRAERMETHLSSMLANTLAAIAAESDDPSAAWRYEEKSLPDLESDPPKDADWYVIGRIAESYGLRDDAVAAYRKVAKPVAGHGGIDAYRFVRKRLDALGVK